MEKPIVAVVIPTYKSKKFIMNVIRDIGDEVDLVFVVDDCCPEGTGNLVLKENTDNRVRLIRHDENLGVGAAVKTGYQAASLAGAQIAIKIDSDAQMDPALIPIFIRPLILGEADYVKGNRFYDPEAALAMPPLRLIGNAVLSMMAKFSTGYWGVFDPTNGYTAINLSVLNRIPLKKVDNRYFFETDMLFRLNVSRAVVRDIPMSAKYGEETSNLKIGKIIFEFGYKHLRNFVKRFLYNYILRDVSLASLELPAGVILLNFGFFYGAYHWIKNIGYVGGTLPGTIMLSSVAVILGTQFILGFLAYDIQNVPTVPVHETINDGL